VVSPIYQDAHLAVDQAEVHYVVHLTNRTAEPQDFKLSTVDFGSLNDSGGVAFLGTSTSDFSKKYGLASWMKLDQSTVDVPSGKSVEVGVTIANSDSLTVGGHYGAILATAQTAPEDGVIRPRVGVFEVLSSLLLLVKDGPAVNRAMEVVSQTTNGSLMKFPGTVTDKFRNTGNVHVVPRGVVEIRDPLGRLVARGAINEDSGIMLPQMERKYETPLMRLAAVYLPGRYSVNLTYRFDGTTSTKSFTASIWYLGRAGVWGGLAVILLILGAGVWGLRRRLRA
jgi:hypothetical protein